VYEVSVKAYLKLEPIVCVTGRIEVAIRGLAPVVTVNGSLLSWTAVDGAACYQIFKETAYFAQISGTSLEVEAGIYTVVAVFDDERLNSPASQAVVVGAYEVVAPRLTLNGDYIEWTAVEGAMYYEIYVNGTLAKKFTGTRYNFRPHYIEFCESDYPNGVTITVVAYINKNSKSPHSNEVFFKA
jgi:hypothetical protein